jgi:L-proline amide hydrolase
VQPGEGRLVWEEGTTWYRVVGEAVPGRRPVVICHGGPGAAHDYVERIANLSRDGRQCILYDQLGCGKSEHLPHQGARFWTVELFRRELDALIRHLGIGGGYHLVGQSWGGMLGMEHALRRPPALRSLVVCDSPASMSLWVEEAMRLRRELPQDVQDALDRHEAAGTTDDPEYEQATIEFYKRHVCRVFPFPDDVQRTFDQLAEDPTVYNTMNGPNEFHVIGTLRDWDITAKLSQIYVPTLLVSGAHDEATPRIMRAIATRIPVCDWVLFDDSSHMPHVEEPERFLDVVGSFLRRIEA